MEYTGIEPNGRQAVNRAAAEAWRGSGGLEGEPDHRDAPTGLARVIREPRQRRDMVRPQSVSLRPVPDDRGRPGDGLVVDLDLHGRVGVEVVQPGRVLGRPAGRAGHDVVLAVAVVRQQRRPGLTGLGAVEVITRMGWPARGPVVTVPSCARMSARTPALNSSMSLGIRASL